MPSYAVSDRRRTQPVRFFLDPREIDLLRQAAQQAGLRLTDWTREVALNAAARAQRIRLDDPCR